MKKLTSIITTICKKMKLDTEKTESILNEAREMIGMKEYFIADLAEEVETQGAEHWLFQN